jgi:hypothetical protein
MVKFMAKTIIHGGISNSVCFNLAEDWAPEAIQSAKKGLSTDSVFSQPPVSCASEVIKRMGGSDEEAVMVSGFAGGMGLSGNACGALGAAIWKTTINWCRKHPGETPPFFKNPDTQKVLKKFNDATGSEILCHKICGQSFNTIDDHSEFIKNGGCNKLMNMLVQS